MEVSKNVATTPKYVLLYESADDVLSKAPAHAQAHSERGRHFNRQGKLLMFGAFAEAQRDGAMAIFTSREAAEEFAEGDPFVVHGVVAAWRILEWNEAFV